jgi:hypothetical protein
VATRSRARSKSIARMQSAAKRGPNGPSSFGKQSSFSHTFASISLARASMATSATDAVAPSGTGVNPVVRTRSRATDSSDTSSRVNALRTKTRTRAASDSGILWRLERSWSLPTSGVQGVRTQPSARIRTDTASGPEIGGAGKRTNVVGSTVADTWWPSDAMFVWLGVIVVLLVTVTIVSSATEDLLRTRQHDVVRAVMASHHEHQETLRKLDLRTPGWSIGTVAKSRRRGRRGTASLLSLIGPRGRASGAVGPSRRLLESHVERFYGPVLQGEASLASTLPPGDFVVVTPSLLAQAALLSSFHVATRDFRRLAGFATRGWTGPRVVWAPPDTLISDAQARAELLVFDRAAADAGPLAKKRARAGIPDLDDRAVDAGLLAPAGDLLRTGILEALPQRPSVSTLYVPAESWRPGLAAALAWVVATCGHESAPIRVLLEIPDSSRWENKELLTWDERRTETSILLSWAAASVGVVPQQGRVVVPEGRDGFSVDWLVRRVNSTARLVRGASTLRPSLIMNDVPAPQAAIVRSTFGPLDWPQDSIISERWNRLVPGGSDAYDRTGWLTDAPSPCFHERLAIVAFSTTTVHALCVGAITR